ncbi:MAG: ATP-dependent helicase, partial [Spirochaetaceae bacterium]|nr:ATP-dependent helicase [Spirochaetaceae bacterium]
MVAKQLDERGYEAVAMHGDIPQAQREKILQRFRTRKTRILVATDVAARGIDIEGLSHVVNYSLPFDPQTYIHRIGRTGRAGAKGIAFTLVRPEERRKLEFLKSATKKATKGSLTEETIPSIKQVLAAKKERLFTEMKQSLGFTSEIAEDSSDILEDSQGEIIDQSQEPKEKTPESFVTLAKELCENRDAQEVLAAVLALSYGRALNPDRYGSITPIKTQNQDNQIRLYVGLGRRDGFNPREIASYFSQLLRIPQRLVDRIDVADNFSLVSLPRKAALDVLERSRRDRNLPHIHIDSKNDSYTEKSSRGRKGDNRNKSFGRGKDRFFDDKARNSKKSNTFSNDANIRRTKTSNAGLYRKSQNKKTSGNIY